MIASKSHHSTHSMFGVNK